MSHRFSCIPSSAQVHPSERAAPPNQQRQLRHRLWCPVSTPMVDWDSGPRGCLPCSITLLSHCYCCCHPPLLHPLGYCTITASTGSCGVLLTWQLLPSRPQTPCCSILSTLQNLHTQCHWGEDGDSLHLFVCQNWRQMAHHLPSLLQNGARFSPGRVVAVL